MADYPNTPIRSIELANEGSNLLRASSAISWSTTPTPAPRNQSILPRAMPPPIVSKKPRKPRVFLTENETLILVRFCVQRQKEYINSRGKFWEEIASLVKEETGNLYHYLINLYKLINI